MPEIGLSDAMRARVEAFCEELAGSCGLPEAARAELRDHFQDRMLGYLDGTDALTEEDAFCLAREHFGNVEEVRELFGEVHDGLAARMRSAWLLWAPTLMFLGFAFFLLQMFTGIEPFGATWYGMQAAFYGALGIMVYAILQRGRDPRGIDRLFGWCFLAIGAGEVGIQLHLLVGWALLQMLARAPMTFAFFIANTGLAFAVAFGFLRRRAWTRWVVVAMLTIPLFVGAVQNLEMGFLVPPAPAVQQAPAHVAATRELCIPPKGFSEAFLALALIHAFLPLNRGRLPGAVAARQPSAQ